MVAEATVGVGTSGSGPPVPDDPLATGSFYAPTGEAFKRFICQNWGSRALAQLPPHASPEHYESRRARLIERFSGDVLVVPAGVPRPRCGDQTFPFRPSSDYVYLTGDQQPRGVLVLDGRDGTARATLFLLPSERKVTPAFFEDRQRSELWVGPVPTLEEVESELGIECARLDDLSKMLEQTGRCRVLRGLDPLVDAAVRPLDFADRELAAVLSEHRLIKDAWEIEELQGAVDATARAFDEVVASLSRVAQVGERGERYVEGLFALWARVLGNGVGYSTIAAAGPHATVAHWMRNDGPLREGTLLLLDAGVESSTLYTADITRTLPVSGAFTPAQRSVYELVLEAQDAGLAALQAGRPYKDFFDAADRVLAAGLASWGILPKPLARSMEELLHRRYTLYPPGGHMLGLDVHDCGKARASMYIEGSLAAGHVLTVEPGLYFQPDDLSVPEELRGIGVRIEDDVLITNTGCTVLSSAMPRRPEEVEAWVQQRQRNDLL